MRAQNYQDRDQGKQGFVDQFGPIHLRRQHQSQHKLDQNPRGGNSIGPLDLLDQVAAERDGIGIGISGRHVITG